MSTIQNLKNFIRHGKQARNAHGDPTTNISPVNAHQQRYQPPPPAQHQHAISDPAIRDHKPLQQAHIPGGDYSAANIDNRNVAAQAGGAAAKAAGDKQKMQERTKDLDPSVIERIVAEERESKGKLPKYPGLERWTLLEKMGDGAFSNVYRAKDSTGQSSGEVAIKVVRKFEMNSSQVGRASVVHFRDRISFPSLSTYFPCYLSPHPHPSTLPILALGRRPPSPGLQKATQGCGGASLRSSYPGVARKLASRYHGGYLENMLILDVIRTEGEYIEGGANHAPVRSPQHCQAR